VTGPIRTCAGCGRKARKQELLRFVAREGTLEPGRAAPGRGVYTCRRLACFERALARRAFARVLRQPVTVDPALSSLYANPPLNWNRE
jgi:predicted RNA-binding protein YlxR (DUF448 family)